jgi:hypothetical protein
VQYQNQCLAFHLNAKLGGAISVFIQHLEVDNGIGLRNSHDALKHDERKNGYMNIPFLTHLDCCVNVRASFSQSCFNPVLYSVC